MSSHYIANSFSNSSKNVLISVKNGQNVKLSKLRSVEVRTKGSSFDFDGFERLFHMDSIPILIGMWKSLL